MTNDADKTMAAAAAITYADNRSNLLDLGRQRAALQAQAKGIADQIAVLDEQIQARLGIGEGVNDDEIKISVTQSVGIDLVALAADHPAEAYPDLYEQKISTALVKDHFAPADLKGYAKPSKPSVRVIAV